MSSKVKSLRDVRDDDVELCRITSKRTCEEVMNQLIENQVSFSGCWKTIPFFKRNAYRGAKEVCIISTYRGQYSRARASVDRMDRRYKNRIQLNII